MEGGDNLVTGSVDDRIVEMSFNNRSFETAVAVTLGTLQKLKNALNFTDSTKNLDNLDAAASKFNMGNIGSSVEGVSKKFLALSTIGITALATIASKAVNTGITLAKSLTIDPIKAGFESYETQINAVQTILANTQAAGTTLPQVTAALKELNNYANLTVYNFSEMARNIGTFTAAGVDLKTSVSSIKGIANLAALSGSSAEQASGAMYQLSQAIASGVVRLQDWNSVNAAGIGGKTFQDALVNTARVSGVQIDAIIKKQGSFRNSLQAGWLTSKILTKTLDEFTGDLSEKQLKAMGFTEKEAQAIFKMGQTAVGAATKIKTITQLTQALKEEVATAYGAIFKTVLGNITEATKLLSGIHTSVENALTIPIYTLNTLLEKTAKLGGRAKVIDGFTNAIHGMSAVFKTVTGAFREIFPAKTAKDLYSFIVAFDNFTKKLIPGKVTLLELKKTFAGVFAVLDIGKQIVSGIVGVLVRLFGAFQGGGGAVLDVTSTIGDYLVALDKAIKNGQGLTDFFKKLGDILVVPVKFLKEIASAIGSLFANIDDNGLDDISSGFDKLGQKISPVGKILSTIQTKIKSFFHTLGVDAAPALQGIVNMFGQFGQSIANAMSTGNFTGVLRVIQTGLLGGILLMVKKFFKGGISLDIGEGFLGKIGEAFEGLTGSLKAMQTNIQSKTLFNIAKAIALLTASVVALSLIDSTALSTALKAMAVGFGELLGSMKILVTISGAAGIVKMPAIAAALDLLATGILILVGAVAILATLSWEDLAQGLVGVGALLAAVSAAAFVLSKNEGGMIAAGIGITAMAVGINILALAVKQFDKLSWSELGKGLAGVGGALAVVALGMQLMPKGMIFTGIGLVAVAVALGGIYIAVKKFSELNWKQIGTGIGGIAASLVAIGLAMRVMPKGMILQATGLVILAGALLVIQKAMSAFAGMSWSAIGKGLAAMAASLIVLAGAMYIMTGAIAGAASMVIITAALAAFVPVLKTLGGMSWGQIGKGLAALAASFALIGVAGLLLGPVIPVLLGLGAAITLISVGVFIAGAGIALLASGLGVLAASGSAGISVLLKAIDAFIGDIPKVAVAFAQGFINILKIIGANGPTIIKAFGEILGAIVKVVIEYAPKIAQGIGVVLEAILKFLVDHAPNLIAAGLQLLEDLLQGIGDNISKVTTQVVAIVVNFLTALASHAQELVAAGLNVLVHVLEGVQSGIGKIVVAVGSIITTFISAVANQLVNIVTAGANLVISFVTGLGQNAGRIVTAGTNAILKFIEGIGTNSIEMVNGAARAVLNFIKGLDQAVKTYEPEIISSTIQLGIDIVTGIFKGIGQEADKLKDSIIGLVTNPLGTLKHIIESHSPSLVFAREIGAPIAQGIAVGINDQSYLVTQAMHSMAYSALDTMTTTLSKIPDMLSGISDVNPVLTPVLDLTQITKDAARLNALISVTPISTDIAFKAANTISLSQQQQAAALAEQTIETPPAPITFEYSQTNVSPKALSTLDIYRQTKNQLSQAKTALGVSP